MRVEYTKGDGHCFIRTLASHQGVSPNDKKLMFERIVEIRQTVHDHLLAKKEDDKLVIPFNEQESLEGLECAKKGKPTDYWYKDIYNNRIFLMNSILL